MVSMPLLSTYVFSLCFSISFFLFFSSFVEPILINYAQISCHKFGGAYFSYFVFVMWWIWRKHIFLSFRFVSLWKREQKKFLNHDPPINKREKKSYNSRVLRKRIRKKNDLVLDCFFVFFFFFFLWLSRSHTERKKERGSRKDSHRARVIQRWLSSGYNDKYYFAFCFKCECRKKQPQMNDEMRWKKNVVMN